MPGRARGLSPVIPSSAIAELVGDVYEAAVAPDRHGRARCGSLGDADADVSIGEGSTVERSVILNGSRIGEDCQLRDCIVAAGCQIGARTRITGGAVLGEGVTIGAQNVLDHGVRVFPGTEIGDGAITF